MSFHKNGQERFRAEMTYLKRDGACTLHARYTNYYFLETGSLITLKYTKLNSFEHYVSSKIDILGFVKDIIRHVSKLSY